MGGHVISSRCQHTAGITINLELPGKSRLIYKFQLVLPSIEITCEILKLCQGVKVRSTDYLMVHC